MKEDNLGMILNKNIVNFIMSGVKGKLVVLFVFGVSARSKTILLIREYIDDF